MPPSSHFKASIHLEMELRSLVRIVESTKDVSHLSRKPLHKMPSLGDTPIATESNANLASFGHGGSFSLKECTGVPRIEDISISALSLRQASSQVGIAVAEPKIANDLFGFPQNVTELMSGNHAAGAVTFHNGRSRGKGSIGPFPWTGLLSFEFVVAVRNANILQAVPLLRSIFAQINLWESWFNIGAFENGNSPLSRLQFRQGRIQSTAFGLQIPVTKNDRKMDVWCIGTIQRISLNVPPDQVQLV